MVDNKKLDINAPVLDFFPEYSNPVLKVKAPGVAKIEKEHEERYMKLLENVENGLVFSKDGDKIWKCRNCGHIHIGKEAPEVCPVCAHPKAHFEIKAENY